MTASARTLRRLIDLLLDDTQPPGVHRKATQAWYRAALEWSGMGTGADALLPHEPLMTDQRLPSGKAISPIAAARCVVEYQRTAVFLRAMDAALRVARERFPGETIHVIEAGCGPLAPLTLPFALRYPAEEVVFTLLDVHPAALASAQRLVEELGAQASLHALRLDDAATVQFSESDRPHIIACEVLLRALTKEPQVAVTRNLAPQLRRGGIFLPERIEVRAALFDAHEHCQPPINGMTDVEIASRGLTDLGPVFTLAASEAAELRMREPGVIAAGTVNVPPHDPARTPLHLTTRLQVFRDHVLGDFESSLNLPQRVKEADTLATRGGRLEFGYELSSTPGLRARFA